MIIDCAYYVDGVRQRDAPMSMQEVSRCDLSDSSFVWLGLYEPTAEELQGAQETFHLHELAVEDALNANQRPKLEDYGDSSFVVIKTARYDDAAEAVEFGEIDIFLGVGYVVVVRHGQASEMGLARHRLEARPELARLGPTAALWAILDKVVDDYEPVVEGIDNDISEVEEQVFSQSGDPTARIYFLKREVIEFHRAIRPLMQSLEQLERGSARVDQEFRNYFRDVADHARRIDEGVLSHRDLLTSVLEANLALVSVRQADVVQAISAWAAIITVPTFIASVYGMNFASMPELNWSFGYPLVLASMAATVVALYRMFRRTGWL